MKVKPMSIKEQIKDLLLEHKQTPAEFKGLIPTRRTLEDQFIKAYIRMTVRRFPDETVLCSTLDIGSVDVFPQHRGKGYFRELMQFIETLPFDYVYVELVHNPRLREMLEKNEYVRYPRGPIEEYSYYKMIGNDTKNGLYKASDLAMERMEGQGGA